ncbi:ATP-dependent nuclease [Lactobacillus equicursoris]|uniref:ATP-dependent nuclease n=1 Tax=Lactobacillus equicursoris TaxID=420645 RepID=UPI00399576B9
MLLKSVELHNFRGYRNFKLNFAPLTSLLGEGDSGKKTILRALDIFFNGPLAKRPLKLQDLNERALKDGDWEISITCFFEKLAIKKKYDLKNYLAETDYFCEDGNDFEEVTPQNRKHFRQLLAQLPMYVFFDRESKATSPLKFVVRSAIRDKQAEIKEVQDYIDERVGRNLSQILANYKDLGEEPAPQFVFEEQDLAEMIKRQARISESANPKPSQLILSFLLAQSENASIDNVIYAFEEEDLTEDEDAKLAQAVLKLVAKNKQVILIPNSPHLMGLLPLEGIKIIENVGGKRQILTDDQVFAAAQKLGISGSQRAGRSSCVLLVEGQEDVRFITKINQWLYEEGLVSDTFDHKGLFILPVGGCGSLLAWLNFDLFSKLNEPWFILIDSDKGTPEAGQSRHHLQQIKAKYPEAADHIHATYKREIENYLVFKDQGRILKFEPDEDVKQHMYDLMTSRKKRWIKDKTASKLMEKMSLKDLQDHYQSNGQDHRELVEFLLKIDQFIDQLPK